MRAVKPLILLLLAVSGATAQVQDPHLKELQAGLPALRQHRGEHRETRGATADLTKIKHLIRDWVETRLAGVNTSFDEDRFNREIQEAMLSVHVVCPDGCATSALGYAAPARVRRDGDLVTLQTSVGIDCGYDDSAYLYEWDSGTWHKILETEQNTYTQSGYLPQTLYGLQASPPDARGTRLVLSLGSKPGCSSAYQPLYYRAWRIGPRGAPPKLLLDASEIAYMGDYPPVKGTVSLDDVRLEFTMGGTGYGESHQAVRHFEVRGEAIRQIEPIAPTPRDFVEEWLDMPWSRSARWSESASLEQWHTKMHRNDGMGDFPDPPLKCATGQDLWQIGIRLHGVEGATYYLVRWRKPDRFTMVDISDRPACR